MKTKAILLAILGFGIIFTSCQDDDLYVVPSNKITTVDVSVSNFNKLNVSDMFKVYVNFSETEESVQVEANDNVHQLININQQGDHLNIALYENTEISGTPVLNVYIKTASLERIQAMGASNIEFQNLLITNVLEIDLEGACVFKGQLEVDELLANLLGASEMDISGNTKLLDIGAEGASILTGFNFVTNNLEANLNGASNISLTVNQKLDVRASGASNVYYKGSGAIENQNLSDTSKIIKVD
jgi:hypothetical protein